MTVSRAKRAIHLADYFAENLKKAGWTQANDSQMAICCMIPPEGPHAVQRYVDKANKDGRFWIAKVDFEGGPVLRVCITNGRTDEAVIDQLTNFLTTDE